MRPSVSVVVASRDRPAALRRCLLALEQQFLPGFEVVVVADAAGCAVAAAGAAKVVPFAAANVAAARNAGIAAAAGEVVAFIDDDAAAEPTWLARLTAPFAEPRVAAAGGYVLGRNGLSFQWRARALDVTGISHPLALPPGGWVLPDPGAGRAVRVEGTSMAFRRTVLERLGGFDPAFAFYHDETDLCRRLAQAGEKVALVPGAVVHHGVLPSERRRADRMPRDLAAVGESSAVFLRKHAPDRIGAARAALRDEQRQRLIRHMVAGRCVPGDVSRLLATLERGFDAGLARPLLPHAVPAAAGRLRPFATPPTGSAVVAGPLRRAALLRDQARAARAAGQVVTLLLLSPTTLYHHVRFGEDGIWLQRGGLWGRSERNRPLFQPFTLRGRIAAERIRIDAFRQDCSQPVAPGGAQV